MTAEGGEVGVEDEVALKAWVEVAILMDPVAEPSTMELRPGTPITGSVVNPLTEFEIEA